MVDFGRLITAMVTPFNEKGEVDLNKTTDLVNYLFENGTESIVVAGTTGESPTLTKEEKVSLFSHVVKIAQGRGKIIAGTGGNNTAQSIELTKLAEQVGVDGIMLVVPYYNKPSQEGLYQHFKTIAENTSLPIMLYNIPGRSGVNMNTYTVKRLAAVDNIVAIKEASGDLTQMSDIIRETPEDFRLYSGDDKLTIPCMSVGGYGIVSVASHLVGLRMKEMIEAFVDGKTTRAAELHRELLPFFEGMFITSNPVPLKAALEMSGISVGGVRLPLVSLTESESQFIENLLARTVKR
ncbi:4-hydroxy-tetrahydrodipicolinate synthase [Microaerobacter geothermalis]|uniref:4-hydroxy-tetrahydrodipicolinate synthase n=1 Tax=Microaerobacter geothermalis TaxID=674972 RepID=UPI001F26FE81|nr:4-hydroxy-tetrahydrodipicolinate synthase [Microaerobacter geothermalis]MCF6093174.1 4-hydroxy-tetrahydrodipicolinate synthase [Microaerobacter geothermalis]